MSLAKCKFSFALHVTAQTKSTHRLVCGDVRGRLQAFFDKIDALNRKAGPFSVSFFLATESVPLITITITYALPFPSQMVLCVGSFFSVDEPNVERQWAEYTTSSTRRISVPTYILGPGSASERRFYGEDISDDGATLCENLIYLGQRGLLTSSSGLRIAYASAESGLTPESVDELIARCRSSGRAIDLLLTHLWPAGVERFSTAAARSNTAVDNDSASSLCARLALGLRPRYHFAGARNVFFERAPYRNHKIAQAAQQSVTRFIALAEFGNAERRKALYAFNVVPASAMTRDELVKQPADATECPFDLAVLQRHATSKPPNEDDDERASTSSTPQYFFDMPTGAPKRSANSDDAERKRRRGPGKRF